MSRGLQPGLDGFGRSQREASPRAWEPGDHGTCRNCEHEIPPVIARVVGDNEGRVPACEHCHPEINDTPSVARKVREGRRR